MLARVRSAAVLGIDAYLVDVETDIANGLPADPGLRVIICAYSSSLTISKRIIFVPPST